MITSSIAWMLATAFLKHADLIGKHAGPLAATARRGPWGVRGESPARPHAVSTGARWHPLQQRSVPFRCNSVPKWPRMHSNAFCNAKGNGQWAMIIPQGQQAPPRPMLVPSGTSAVNLSCTRRELAPLQQRSVPFRCNSVRWHQCCRAGPSRDAEASYVGAWSVFFASALVPAGHAQARLPSTDPAPKIPEQRCGTVAPTCHKSRACRARGVKFAGYDVGSVIMGNGQCSMLNAQCSSVRERERESISLLSLTLSHG